jgi:hypothetical protein
MSIENYNKVLQKFLLQKVIFKCDNKILKTGKIKLFNTKQYFIRFNIENDKGEIKQLELPYPFAIHDNGDTCTLNYHLSSFTHKNIDVIKRINNTNSEDSMRMYNRLVQIIPV